jgi:hypothetical protein
MVLAGLAPITAIWVASYRSLDALVLPSLAWGIAGVMGVATVNARLARAVHAQPRDLSLGTITVLALFTVFSLVLGVRLWFSILAGFGPFDLQIGAGA